ncbi:MAG: alkaline phosphatase family protein [Actinomycetota bacterium]
MASPTAEPASIDTALSVLCDSALDPIVEMVLLARDGAYEAHAPDGSVRFERSITDGPRHDWEFTELEVRGRNPLGDQARDRFAPLAEELAHRFPHRTDNAYPFAYEQVAQLFDHPAAPDLCVIHTSAHHWASLGGHIGEHGSLASIQCRAPFIVSGCGAARLGMTDMPAQLVDIAPTVLALLGLDPTGGTGLDGRRREDAHLLAQDGDVLTALLDPRERPDLVVGFLLDGCNPNVLYDMAASGEAPHVARLMAEGSTLRNGIVSSLPTVTLPNHTTVITGRHPGHHGVLHNAWWDRSLQQQVVTNSPATWISAMDPLLGGTDSIHAAIRRAEPEAFTASINEPADPGAVFSTFDLMRRGVRVPFPKTAEGLPHATEMFVRPVKDYATFTQVDHHGVTQAVGIIEGRYLDTDYPLPRFMWVNFSLTDSAFHEGGPHSEIARASVRDTDGRIGEVLDALDRRGVSERTAVFLCADHGMEESQPGVDGDWTPALRDAGIDVRDEAFGFLYLDPTKGAASSSS